MAKNKKNTKKALEIKLKPIHKLNFIIYGILVVLLIVLFTMIGNKQIMTTEELQQFANENCYGNITIPNDGNRYAIKIEHSVAYDKPICELRRMEDGS